MGVIKAFFAKHLPAEPQQTPDNGLHEVHLASAALMFEVIRSDHQIKPEEIQNFRQKLTSMLNLSADEIEDVVRLAEDEADAATSLYQFTAKITKHFGPEQRIGLIENLWRMAYADNELDKYEDYTIRKVANLIHVSTADTAYAHRKARDEKRKK